MQGAIEKWVDASHSADYSTASTRPPLTPSLSPLPHVKKKTLTHYVSSTALPLVLYDKLGGRSARTAQKDEHSSRLFVWKNAHDIICSSLSRCVLNLLGVGVSGNEVDCILNGEDLLGLSVGDGDDELLFESHANLNSVKGIESEVVDEVCGGGD